MTNEASQSDPLKSESNANLLGQKITLPGVSTDSADASWGSMKNWISCWGKIQRGENSRVDP